MAHLCHFVTPSFTVTVSPLSSRRLLRKVAFKQSKGKYTSDLSELRAFVPKPETLACEVRALLFVVMLVGVHMVVSLLLLKA